MKGRDAAPDLNYRSRSSCPVLNCPLEAPFLPTLAGAVLRGSIWNTTPPEPHELPAISIYLPAHASVEPLKLAFLAQSPNKATFLPRIRVLGDVDPLDLFAAFGTRIASANIAVNLLEKALAIPAAFTKLERELKLSALISQAEEQLYSTRLAEGERVFANFEAVSAYTIARDIASIIDETLADEADMSRLFRLDGQHGSE